MHAQWLYQAHQIERRAQAATTDEELDRLTREQLELRHRVATTPAASINEVMAQLMVAHMAVTGVTVEDDLARAAIDSAMAALLAPGSLPRC